MASVRYIVDDVESAVAFYSEMFGFTTKEKWGSAFAIVVLDDIELWLSGPGTSARRPLIDGAEPHPGGWNRIVIQPNDFTDCVAKLKAANRLRNEPVTGPGGTQALVSDPSGNLVEIFEARS